MGAAQKVSLKGTGRGSQPFRGTARKNPPVGIAGGLAKGIQKKAATDAFRGNDKLNRKSKGNQRPIPGPPPDLGTPPDLGPSPGKGPSMINKPVAPPPPSLMGPPGQSGLVTPNYGERIGAPPGSVFTGDFKDSDDDGIDDRQQAGPGLAPPSPWMNKKARNEQRNASENRMRRNDRRKQRKSGIGR